MRRILLVATAALALAGCAGSEPMASEAALPASARRYAVPNWEYTFYRWATPPSIVNPAPANEVGIRFRSAVSGRVAGLRFYRPAGNTENVKVTLRNESGDSVRAVSLPGLGAPVGWQWLYLSNPYTVQAGVNLRVSAKVSQTLGKTPGLFAGGPVVKDMLTADLGFYFLPGSPTMYSTNDGYFVDVYFWADPE